MSVLPAMDMEMNMMHMSFYQNADVTFLFKGLQSTNTGGYILGLVITFLLSVSIEFFSFCILMVKIKTNKEQKITPIVGFVVQMLLYSLQLLIAFAVMLLVMTYNGLVFITVICGITTGYAVFGFMKLNVQGQINEKGYECVAEKCCS